jgi:CHAT domain-containing protein
LAITHSELVAQVRYLRDLIAERDFDLERAADLYDTLFAPLTPHIRHANLIIAPHDVLHYLPFGALWDGEQERYLIDGYALTYTPSASTLPWIAKPTASLRRLAIFGNPDGTLPHAESEVQAVAKLFAAQPFTGTRATESRFYREASRADILHLAAHGRYDPLNPLHSYVALAGDNRHDGRVEVVEVFGLDLAGVNLVVLSACETALGEQSAGDELVGLARAFLYAGSPTVVTSLWAVDDEATRALMMTFYRHLRTGLTPAQALQSAQSAVAAQPQWQSPYFWAGFTLTGGLP